MELAWPPPLVRLTGVITSLTGDQSMTGTTLNRRAGILPGDTVPPLGKYYPLWLVTTKLRRCIAHYLCRCKKNHLLNISY